MSDDRALEAAAEALNEHLSGSGNWRNATPAMAQKAVAAYLDCLLDGLPEEAVGQAARAYATRAWVGMSSARVEVRPILKAALLSLRAGLGAGGGT